MEYNFIEIEKKWQSYWAENKTFRAENTSSKPKYYVLDMFPYPSGAGLHVGHPLGYIASDIVARYKRLKGFNVLHPMGYDSFGLPAEQYAIQTGQHPATTTEENIKRYRQQLDKIGFSFDWEREVRTSDPHYYKWTQWIFIQLFNSWYNKESNKAEPIEKLISIFETRGFKGTDDDVLTGDLEIYHDGFSPAEWRDFSAATKEQILQEFRLAYLSDTMVNWCPQLGTVLANEEVKDGVSERGGYPVERKLMKQWSLRITAYADRLLNDLDALDWSESIKEAQRNWIGKSEGTSIQFHLSPALPIFIGTKGEIEVFTTRPDTIFGVSFVTLAPEHELVEKITSPEQKKAVDEYVTQAKNRSERDRMADVKKITGVFTGAYVIHPFTEEQIPIWVGDYVLAGYGTGAVMAVPAHDSRDFAFAKHFGLEIKQVIAPPQPSRYLSGPKEREFANSQITTLNKALSDGKVSPIGGDLEGAWEDKSGILFNSGFLNGLEVKDAIKSAIEEIEKQNLGKGKTNFRLRDAIFGRQRYWGEPIPVYYKDGIPHVLSESELPLLLPEVDKYLPTETGEPPLARAKNWRYKPLSDSPHRGENEARTAYEYEYSTMPGWAGSSWYFLRYMDARNEKEFVSKEAADYWQNVDLYIGGSEHATGHLLYVRFWTKFLNDLGLIPVTEPAKKLINQGMIQGRSNFVYRLIYGHTQKTNDETPPIFISRNFLEKNLADSYSEKEEFREFIRNQIWKILKISPQPAHSQEPIGVLVNRGMTQLHVDVNIVNNDVLDIEAFKKWRPEYNNAIFIREENGDYICGSEVEKMSKSKWNVVSPDVMVEQYGADCLRLYEMFLGPLEQSKPWNTNGITGVSNFIRKLWRLYHSAEWNDSPLLWRGAGGEAISDEPASKQELKALHKTIKKIQDDIERFSFNTSVSNFMIFVNELTELKCNKRAVLEPLAILIAPYAPHIAEELWSLLGHKESITYAAFPEYKEEYTVESAFNYPVSFNGKTKFFQEFELSLSKEDLEKEVLSLEQTKKYLGDKQPKKVIVVHNKIVNIVV